VTGLVRIIRLAWEHVCPYEIYWGIVDEPETPVGRPREGLPRTVFSAMTKSPPTTSPVLPQETLWPR
jgi:hypothetical protein